MSEAQNDLAGVIKQRRISLHMTICDVSSRAGISASTLSRIEAGKRFPSARILRKLAEPLDLTENQLFVLAGFLPDPSKKAGIGSDLHDGLDPYVAECLSREKVVIQRAVLVILNLLRYLA